MFSFRKKENQETKQNQPKVTQKMIRLNIDTYRGWVDYLTMPKVNTVKDSKVNIAEFERDLVKIIDYQTTLDEEAGNENLMIALSKMVYNYVSVIETKTADPMTGVEVVQYAMIYNISDKLGKDIAKIANKITEKHFEDTIRNQIKKSQDESQKGIGF